MNILFREIYRFNAIPIKLPMVSFQRIKIKKFIIYMKTQKTSNSQNNFEKELEVQESGSLNSDYITKLQSNQNSIILTQKWKCR